MQKTRRDCADATWRGSSFQTPGAVATGEARPPTVNNRVGRSISDDDDAERRRPRALRSGDRRNWSARYDGAVPCKYESHVAVFESEK